MSHSSVPNSFLARGLKTFSSSVVIPLVTSVFLVAFHMASNLGSSSASPRARAARLLARFAIRAAEAPCLLAGGIRIVRGSSSSNLSSAATIGVTGPPALYAAISLRLCSSLAP